MKNFCVFDTEDDSKGNFYLGWVRSDRGYAFFENSQEMREYIVSNFSTAYAHNIGYDLGNIFKDDLMKLNYNYAGSRIIKAVYNQNGCYCLFLDTMNLLPMSIKEIGKYIGLKKKKMEKRSLKNYCKRDVDILWIFLVRMDEIYGKLNIECGYTIGMNALKFFRTMYKGDLYLTDYANQFRQAYYGGRVEIFKYGKIKRTLYENDINSLYPSIMKGITLPDWKNLHFEFKKNRIHYEGISKVYVRSNLKIPLLPVRTNEGLIFPNGFFTGVYTNIELREFIKAGGEIRKFRWTVYSQKTIKGLFDRYVNTLYEMRKRTDNEYEKLLFKLLLNSLYGKFGYRGEREVMKSYSDRHFHNENEIIFGKGGIYELEKKKVRTGYQNPLIACYITAMARIKLWKYLLKFSDSMVYCDTDSIYSDRKILPETKELGLMSYRGKYKDGEFILPKLYRVGKKIKSKGIRILTVKGWNDYMRKGFTYTKRPVKIKSAVRHERNVNVWKLERKEILTEYGKRIVHKDGTTEPVELFY